MDGDVLDASFRSLRWSVRCASRAGAIDDDCALRVQSRGHVGDSIGAVDGRGGSNGLRDVPSARCKLKPQLSVGKSGLVARGLFRKMVRFRVSRLDWCVYVCGSRSERVGVCSVGNCQRSVGGFSRWSIVGGEIGNGTYLSCIMTWMGCGLCFRAVLLPGGCPIKLHQLHQLTLINMNTVLPYLHHNLGQEISITIA